MAETKFFQYKGKPLVRCGDTLYYGDMKDKYVIKMMIKSKQPAAEADFDAREFFGVQPNNAGAPAPQQDNSSLRLKDDEYYEKASQLVEGSEAQARPARRPARHSTR